VECIEDVIGNEASRVHDSSRGLRQLGRLRRVRRARGYRKCPYLNGKSVLPSEADISQAVAARPFRANLGSRGHHSITSSARTSSDDGTVNPSAWAVLRLIANWYFVRACAGRLADFSPLKMYRIEALLQDKTSMITASTATIRRRSTPLGFEAALSRTGTEASARACARSGSAAWEAVTSWAGSARKPSRARVLSLPGSP